MCESEKLVRADAGQPMAGVEAPPAETIGNLRRVIDQLHERVTKLENECEMHRTAHNLAEIELGEARRHRATREVVDELVEALRDAVSFVAAGRPNANIRAMAVDRWARVIKRARGWNQATA